MDINNILSHCDHTLLAVDATWNDNDKENHINYFYFNVTDDVIKKDHFNILPVKLNEVTRQTLSR